MVVIGDKLGLYRAMASGREMTPDELAAETKCVPRYIREWLNNQAAGGYVEYHPESGGIHFRRSRRWRWRTSRARRL